MQELGYSVAMQVFQESAIEMVSIFILDNEFGLRHDYCPQRASAKSIYNCSWGIRAKPTWSLVTNMLGGHVQPSSDGC